MGKRGTININKTQLLYSSTCQANYKRRTRRMQPDPINSSSSSSVLPAPSLGSSSLVYLSTINLPCEATLYIYSPKTLISLVEQTKYTVFPWPECLQQQRRQQANAFTFNMYHPSLSVVFAANANLLPFSTYTNIESFIDALIEASLNSKFKIFL